MFPKQKCHVFFSHCMMILGGCLLHIVLWTASSTALADPYPAAGKPVKSIGNLHMHTTCSDGRHSYEEMVQEALKLKMTFIAVTDHQYGGSPLCDETIRKCRNETRLLCIPGMEVTGRVHLLAIGIQSPVNRRLSVKKQVEEIHRQGGLAIAAHPFRSINWYSNSDLFESGLDAVECRDIPDDRREEFLVLLKRHAIPCVYNSDAHSTADMALRWNVCRGRISSLDDLRTALLKGQCEP
jgi:hypothetical protein